MVVERIAVTTRGRLAAVMLMVSITIPGCTASDADTPATTATSTAPAQSLPPMKRFTIGGDGYGPVNDCAITGSAVTCTASWDDPYQADSYTGTFTGTLSGMQMTGVSTTRQTGHDASDPACRWETETSTPLTYLFDVNETVTNRQEPGQWRTTRSGSCSGTETGSTSAGEGGAVRWTVIE